MMDVVVVIGAKHSLPILRQTRLAGGAIPRIEGQGMASDFAGVASPMTFPPGSRMKISIAP
jgi:hypothetical protein